MKISNKIFFGLSLIIVLFSIVTFININLSKEIKKQIEWMVDREELIKNSSKIQKIVIDLETGLRGYLLSDKEEFLEPYKDAKSSYKGLISSQINELKNNSLVLDLMFIERRIDYWIEYFAEPLIYLKSKSIENKNFQNDYDKLFSATAKKGVGKRITDSIRDKFESIDDVLIAERNKKNIELQRQISFADNFSLIINLLGAITSLLIVFSITRTIRRRINKMVSFSESLSLGNYNELIIDNKKDELSELSKALNIMAMTISDNVEHIKKTNIKLLNANVEIEKSYKIKELFLANISHEIRTPLNAIIGFTDLAMKTDLDSKQNEYISIVKKSSYNLLQIVNDILDFSKLNSGNIKIEEKEFNLENEITNVYNLLKPLSDEKGLKLKLIIDKNVPRGIIGDKLRLNQILINIINNAIKFTFEGEVNIHVSLHSVKENINFIQFKISDTGLGIKASQIDLLFKSFTQLHNNGVKYSGTGLGLAIVKKLVDSMDGKIEVESEFEKGSKFTVTLGFRISYQNEVQFMQNKERNYDLKGLSILLVEDNNFNRLLIERLFENWNSNLKSAVNSVEAIELCKTNCFDLILMDIQLPDKDGIETAIDIRGMNNCNYSIPIIAFTAHSSEEEKTRSYAAGLNEYILKPFDENELFDKIVKLTNKNNKQDLYNLNIDYLTNLSKNDDEFISKILNEFLKLSVEAIERIEKYKASNDYNSMSPVLHKLKSSLYMVGLESLRPKVVLLEDKIKNETYDKIFFKEIENLIFNLENVNKEIIEKININ